ncbi:cytochrome P450 [Micromonospora sp. WMMC415]|nr:cytochrome P450 [Micromonospora sp. WMMC415]QGN50762.1 cytochrome P450 [Micromonospora sp. WMMC415]
MSQLPVSSTPPIPAQASTIPLHRALPALLRDPLGALVRFADEARGEVVRLNLGTFRPYLVSHPEHLQYVLRDNVANYIRDGDGLLWRPVRRIVGEAILVAEGDVWESSRGALQPLFTAKRAETLVDRMAEAIGEAVDGWAEPAGRGQPIDAGRELTRIVLRTTMRVLFADRISVPDAERISAALDTVTTAMLPRLLVPFVPYSVPMPGDRAFRNAVRTIDDVVLPIIREARARPSDGDDIISVLCRPRPDGRQPDEYQVRGDVVAMFSTATETTIALLSWLWPVLEAYPEVAGRLREELDQVVGGGPVRREHLPELRYGRMVLEELLRLYPAGWMIPRTAVADDVLGGVRVDAGATVLVSPYVTQRMAMFWPEPDRFDPERFAPGRPRRRYRYSYYPFGGGPHQCLGQYLFLLEAQLIVSTVLSRYHFRSTEPVDLAPRIGASLSPRQRTRLTLRPVEHEPR